MIFLVLVFVAVLFALYLAWLVWTTSHGAPYVALEMDVVERLLEMAQVKEGDIVYDLGSGDGRIPIMVALKYKARAVGIEIDFIRYVYSVFRAALLGVGGKVKFVHKNLFDINLSEATVVTMFLLQTTNEALMEKMVRELRPGTRVVSAAFDFPGWKPLLVDEENATPYGPLYSYEIGV